MAVITEYFSTRTDGTVLVKSYSDAGFYIERDGVQYGEAIDPEECGRVYIETDIPLEEEEDFTDAEFREMVEEAL